MTNDGIKPIGGLKEARPTNNPGEKNHRGNREGARFDDRQTKRRNEGYYNYDKSGYFA